MIDLLGFAQTPFVRGLDAEFCATGSECNPRVIGRAGLVLDDLDLVVTHDCFTNADRMRYEAMGLTPPGAGARALDQGWVIPGVFNMGGAGMANYGPVLERMA